MNRHSEKIFIKDDFGRRSGLDRRRNPELSTGDEKRRSVERRNQNRRRSPSERRSGVERRREISASPGIFWSITDPELLNPAGGIPVCGIGPDRRNGKERRSGCDRRDFMVLRS
jgi:hypothetical protein